MLYYGRIDLSGGVEVAKSNSSKKLKVCRNWYFRRGFNFQNFVCNGCYDFTMFCPTFSGAAIITVKGVDYVLLLIALPSLKQYIC